MADSIVDDGILVAYVDNQLDTEQRELVEKALQENENLRLKLNRFIVSGTLLRDKLDVSQDVTPDHISHRIRMIDRRIKNNQKRPSLESEEYAPFSSIFFRPHSLMKKRSAFNKAPELTNDQSLKNEEIPIRPTDSKPQLNSFFSAILNRFNTNNLMKFGGTFASGVFCAVFLFDSSPMAPLAKEVATVSISEYQLRGSDTSNVKLKQPTVVQNNKEIPNFGEIVENESFSIIWVSPLDGDFAIFEINGDSRKLLFSGKALAGTFIDLPMLVFSDQSELKLEIEVVNNETVVTQKMKLKVLAAQDKKQL
jgi:hypothetical protein